MTSNNIDITLFLLLKKRLFLLKLLNIKVVYTSGPIYLCHLGENSERLMSYDTG